MIGLGLGLGLGTPPGVQFDPSTLPGLKALFDAGLGVTNVSGAASAWADQSGTGDANKNLAQATSGKRPTINATDAAYNNKPTLSFAAASSQLMQSSAWASALPQPFTWFVVGNTSGGGANEYMLEGDVDGSVRCIMGMLVISANWGMYGGTELGSSAARSASPLILGGVMNGSSSRLYMSAKTPVAIGDAGGNGLSGMSVGGSYAGTATLDGKLASMVACAGDLGATYINKLLDFWGSKYGIAIGA